MPSFLARSSNSIIPLASIKSSAGCTPITVIAPPLEGEVPTGVRHVAIMLTRRCNMSCAHCSVESSPHIKGEPQGDELMETLRESFKHGVRSVLLTGGEPMLRENILFELLDEAQKLGMLSTVTSNGFWGKSPEKAQQIVARMKSAGVRLLTISYDRYHADYQGSEPAVNIARAATAAGLTFNVSITRTAQESDLDAIVAPFADVPAANLRFYDVQPIGRARGFEAQTLRAEVSGFCNACTAPALTDDGRVTACNGPSYFADKVSPLILGSRNEEKLETLLRRHREDAILEAIRVHGPQWLLGQLQTLPGFESWARPRYGGMCELCLHLNSDERVTAALRAHLAQPRLQAEFAARRQVIAAVRRDELSREKVNNLGAAHIWWRAALDPTSLDESDVGTILSRADLDWSAQLVYLSQCGLAGPLLPILDHPEIVRWAPQFFRDRMRQQAMLDAMRALSQRDALRDVAASARAENATGILFKGSALIAQNAEAKRPMPLRSCCDLDIYFAPDAASRVHARLIQAGFVACASDLKVEFSRRHQLPPLRRGAVVIEIHQTLLPAFCGLPERAMRRGARRLKNPELRGLRALAPEAALLHNMVHCSKHGWTHGLKSAYDVVWTLRNCPQLNWHWLGRLAARTGMKRGFWAPLVVLTDELELPVPAWFVARAPRDARQSKLQKLVKRYLWSAHAPFQHNPWIVHPVYLLQSDSWLHRARYLLQLALGKPAIEARTANARHNQSHRRQRLAKLAKLGAALRAWRRM